MGQSPLFSQSLREKPTSQRPINHCRLSLGERVAFRGAISDNCGSDDSTDPQNTFPANTSGSGFQELL
jgi:hypothetical protein